MRAKLLRAFVVTAFICSAPCAADEFQVSDGGGGGASFEIGDEGLFNSSPPANAQPTPLEMTNTRMPFNGSTATREIQTAPPPEPSYSGGEALVSPELSNDFWDGNLDCDSGACFDSTPCASGCGNGANVGPFLEAWVAQGFTYNDADPQSGFNTPLTFNDFANDYQLNQVYLAFGRGVNRCCGTWDVGGRIDLLYGTDYFFTLANGLENRVDGQPHWNSDDGTRSRGGFTFADYGLAMPQAFGEIFVPLGSGMSVKFGRLLHATGL